MEKVTKKPKSKWRPQGLDTVELEKLGISKLRMSAKQTMQVAEKLYSKGFISYPRTETNKFPAGLNLTPLVEQQTHSNIWGDFATEVFINFLINYYLSPFSGFTIWCQPEKWPEKRRSTSTDSSTYICRQVCEFLSTSIVS